jgi:hypothetical protein
MGSNMSYRRWLAVVASGSLASILWVSTALAQNGEEAPPILSALLVPAQIVVRIAILMNEILGFWVSGNYTLTDPLGDKLVSGTATIVPQLADFFAQILNIF